MSTYDGFSDDPPPARRRQRKTTSRVVASGFGALPPVPDLTRAQTAADSPHVLGEQVTNLRAQGMTWAQIQVETGIDANECAVIANNYLRSQYTGTSVENARQLQIMRLEMLMQVLYKQVEDDAVLTQGRQTANLITTINSVTELLDLRKDRLRDEQMRVTQEQGGLLLQILQAVEQSVLNSILELLTYRSTYDVESGRRTVPDVAALRGDLERDWSGWFAAAADAKLAEISGDANDSTMSTPADPRTIRGEVQR